MTPIPDISPPTCNDSCYRSPGDPVMYPYHGSGYSSGVGTPPRHDSGDFPDPDNIFLAFMGFLFLGLIAGKMLSRNIFKRKILRRYTTNDVKIISAQKLAWSIAVMSPQDAQYRHIMHRIEKYIESINHVETDISREDHCDVWLKTVARILRSLLDEGYVLSTADRHVLARIEDGRGVSMTELSLLDAAPSASSYQFDWRKQVVARCAVI